jgi:hypothetical protein
MRMSSLFGTALREAPAAAPSEGEALLARAGYLGQAGAGGFELKARGSEEKTIAPAEQAVARSRRPAP